MDGRRYEARRVPAPYTIRDPRRGMKVSAFIAGPATCALLLLLVFVTRSARHQGSTTSALVGVAVCAGLIAAILAFARVVARSCVIADPRADAVIVRYACRRRVVPWPRVEAFDIMRGHGLRGFTQVYLFRTGGRPVRLPLDYRTHGERRPVEIENAEILGKVARGVPGDALPSVTGAVFRGPGSRRCPEGAATAMTAWPALERQRRRPCCRSSLPRRRAGPRRGAPSRN